MDNELRTLRLYLDGDDQAQPSLDQLRTLAARYPYFAAPPATILRLYGDSLNETTLAATRSRLAIMLGDTATAQRTVEDSEGDFYPPAGSRRPNTAQALDTFFAKFGQSSAEEDALLERLIFNPVPDYLDLVSDSTDAPKSLAEAAAEIGGVAKDNDTSQSATPDNHGETEPTVPVPQAVNDQHPTPAAQSAQSKTARNDSGDSLLSESLAKIFIKQGRYERAYEIISNLNLNYPEKSVYFADQLRFLRKLIIIQRRQN